MDFSSGVLAACDWIADSNLLGLIIIRDEILKVMPEQAPRTALRCNAFSKVRSAGTKLALPS